MGVHQLLYTWAGATEGRAGGWGVLDRSAGMEPAVEEALLSRRTTAMRNHPPLPEFAGTDDLARRSRRMRVVPQAYAWLINHVVDAGPAGRPDNVLNHLVWADKTAVPQPITLWGSTGWQMPYKQAEVMASRVPVELPPGVLNRDYIVEWIGTVDAAWVLDAAQLAWSRRQTLVLLTGSEDEAAHWIAAITLLSASDTIETLGWSTDEDPSSLGFAREQGLRLIGMPREEAPAEGWDEDVFALDPSWQVEWMEGGCRLPNGVLVPETLWSDLVLDLSSNGPAELAVLLDRADQRSTEIGAGSAVPLYWALALVVAEEHHDRLAVTRDVLTQAPWRALLQLEPLTDRYLAADTSTHADVVRERLSAAKQKASIERIRQWLAAGAPTQQVPEFRSEDLDAVHDALREPLQQLIAALTSRVAAEATAGREAAMVAELLVSLELVPRTNEDEHTSPLRPLVEALAKAEDGGPLRLEGLSLPRLSPLLDPERERVRRARRVAEEQAAWVGGDASVTGGRGLGSSTVHINTDRYNAQQGVNPRQVRPHAATTPVVPEQGGAQLRTAPVGAGMGPLGSRRADPGSAVSGWKLLGRVSNPSLPIVERAAMALAYLDTIGGVDHEGHLQPAAVASKNLSPLVTVVVEARVGHWHVTDMQAGAQAFAYELARARKNARLTCTLMADLAMHEIEHGPIPASPDRIASLASFFPDVAKEIARRVADTGKTAAWVRARSVMLELEYVRTESSRQGTGSATIRALVQQELDQLKGSF